ncbi:phosphoglycerate kinase [Auritidibacter sp. NML130574]|uniref:phosphoglycerate kinase n=1 Tax=Auritidibacter sp. NML130574 TaxID=2170745 RepID=UPI000D726D69|nr:phosphoglycerate kinase [Auritidibacter sp. NML130574]AXR73493.1 phosphoglycerate kinase [Auritidibacter sp. NML130574]
MPAQNLNDLLEQGVSSRYVLVRSDLNVPLDSGTVTDDGRIRASLPVLEKLATAGAKVIVMAHLGRPKGEPNPEFSLAPVATRLAELTTVAVQRATDLTGEDARSKADALADGSILLLENVRFDPRETSKDDSERAELAAELASLVGDTGVYVNDAFGAVHRKHASVFDIARHLPAYQGDLVATELQVLDQLITEPARPYVVALGGSKVSDKLAVIDNLLDKADTLLIGGGMVFTFLAAQGHQVGSSLLEEDQIDTVAEYLKRSGQGRAATIVLPTDIVMAETFGADAGHEVRPVDGLATGTYGESAMGLDIGPDSAAHYAQTIRAAHTVFWNGPMGVFELPAFAAGTKAVAEALTAVDGLCVVGGGDSAAAVRNLGFGDDQFGHISTGGGASLEYLEGRELPGVQALQN